MKLFFKIIANLFVYVIGFFKKPIFLFLSFCKRVIRSARLMNGIEKKLAISFFVITLVLFSIKVKKDFVAETKIAPGNGGVYKEAVVGEYKYFSPILASSDAEKSTSKLIFSGMVKFDKDNNILPDLAEKWEVSSDGLKYKFYLKNNINFQDGQKFTAQDVVFTVDKIKDPLTKSPLYNAWADVNVSAENDYTVVFELPRAYGPFIYSCDFGVLPSHISEDQFSKKVIGTGPYKFDNSKTKDSKITKIYLEKNGKYFNGSPLINKIELNLFKDASEAKKAFENDESMTALSGVASGADGVKNWNFETTKRLGLILNLRKDNLKDKAFRQKILGGEKNVEPVKISLSTLDNGLQKEKAEEIKKQFADRNIILDIKYYSPVEMQDVLAKKDYELLLYGFDFGHDRDPYTFWHSSQLEQLNFAGYSDKKSDILLEDARMITDPVQRNAKYDEFYVVIKSEYLGTFYDPVKFLYNFRTSLKGVSINCNDVDFRYNGIEKWYLKETRVKK